jgi:hypothetical protein
MLKKTLVILCFFFFAITLSAQDTLRVMVYNLLYYGEYFSNCTASNNNPDNKDANLRTILPHDLPDIFVVNEISRSAYFQERIIDSVLHKITDRVYARAVSYNLADQNIVNMMYYNMNKLALHSQVVMQTITRDIDLYKLYYLSPDLSEGDTAFIHCIAAHLKAGSSAGDQQTRRNQINNVMAWLQYNSQPHNFLFMGDFNVQSVEEESMQALFYGPNHQFRFYDPVDQLGEWNNNPNFAMYHTQSTHTSGGCHSSGGLDDRFDFILASADIMQGNKKVSYVEGSYRTLGQDGLHFNTSLLGSPYNASAPFEVIEALYHNSDHLPVLLSLAIDQSPAVSFIPILPGISFSYNNPVEDILNIHFKGINPGSAYQLNVYSVLGEHIASYSDSLNGQPVQINLSQLKKGFYLVEFKMMQFSKVFKIIKL